MARLPPGFRFHPTDIELIMYYLKRKIMGKKLHFDAITELNIYKFSPWDLPEKCCYKSKDLWWYFFCPRERKYASGARMNRATETGYWKTTGKDRSVTYDEKVVGSVKTLIFHRGHPPRGQRTDWVIHEYKFEDEGLADAGFVQDSYVLCKVFQKSGLGPKNGAQYGAPFNEADWEDDEIPAEPCTSDVLSAPPELPENQRYSLVTNLVDPGSTSRRSPSEEPTLPSIERIPAVERGNEEVLGQPIPSKVSSIRTIPAVERGNEEVLGQPIPSNVSSIRRMSLDEPDDGELPGEPNPSDLFSSLAVLPDKQGSIGAGMIKPGPGPSSAQLCTNEMPLGEQDDEIIGLLAHFTDDPFLLSAGNEKNQQNLENSNQDVNAFTPSIGGNNIFDGLGDITNWAGLGANGGVNYSLNPVILPEDAAYMELNDLETPLSQSTGAIETGQLGLGNFDLPYNSNIDMQQLYFGSNSLGIDHVWENQLPMLPDSYTQQVNHSNMVYNFQNTVNQGYDAATNFNVSSYQPQEDNRFAAQTMERGVQQRKFYSSIFALPGSLCGGSFILVKAEVTLGIVGCTDEALSTILGDSCCVFTCQSNVAKVDFLREVNESFHFVCTLAFICFSHLKRLWFFAPWVLYVLKNNAKPTSSLFKCLSFQLHLLSLAGFQLH